MTWIYKINSAKKIGLLLLGMCLISILMYKASLSKTLELYDQNQQLAEKVSRVENAPEQIKKLSAELARIEEVLKRTKSGSGINQMEAFDYLSDLTQKHQLVVRKYPKPVVNMEKGLNVETIEFTVDGTYRNTILFIQEVEKSLKAGKIASTRFFTHLDIQTRKPSLYTTIYLQLINTAP